MTDADLDRIEGALGVRLPAAYRHAVAPFPVPACAGNADTALWDDPAALIALNEQLRAGLCCVRPWPTHMFAVGRDGGGSAAALDLRDPLGPVVWADRCHLAGPGSGPASPSVAAWVAEAVADLRADLEGNGIDPDGTPQARERAARDSAAADGRVLVWVAVAAALGVWG